MLVINRKANVSLFDNVKEIAGLSLLDNHMTGRNRFHHHGVNQKTPLLRRETREDEVVFQRRVDKLNSSI